MLRRSLVISAAALVAALLMPVRAPDPVAAVEGGGVTAFGGAPDAGSTRAATVAADIMGIAASPSGEGYWQVAADGGVFGFGDAGVFGSMGGSPLNAPIVGMAASPSGGGYWLVASDGGVFTFGDAGFRGSPGGSLGDDEAAAMAVTPDGDGYWIATVGGRVLPYGSATDDGSLAAGCHDQAVVGIAARRHGGYWLSSSAFPREIVLPRADPIAIVGAESEALQTLLRVRQACQPTVEPSTERMTSPLPGARVTSAYGQRIHPVHGKPQFHTGLDMAGRPTILAPADGIVLQVLVRPGYGLTTIIDHGDGIASVLAHQAAVSVHPGDHVTRGRAVGTVGRSGYATGAHLHVEVRVHGIPTDPRRWF